MDQVKHRDMWEDFKLLFARCWREKIECYPDDIHTSPGDPGNAISQLFSIYPSFLLGTETKKKHLAVSGGKNNETSAAFE